MTIGFRSISALKAIRLSESTRTALGNSYAQLSSGQRITKPSIDPGGLAVSMSLAVEAKISDRAKLNVEDGVSLSNNAEAAFDSATDIVQRLNELASQASSGILGTKQREALNSEFVALRNELNRLQKSSQFNGIKINDGAAVSASSKRVGSSSSTSFELSADGRYAFYVEGSTLKMRDTITDEITNLDTGLGAGDIGVSAAGDKIAYVKGGGVTLLDRSTGVSSVVIAGATSNSALEISGDGSTVAVISRFLYNSAGTSSSSDGNYHLIAYNTTTGKITGDDGSYALSVPNARDLQISYNGDFIGVRGTEATTGVTDEINVFSSTDLGGSPLYTTSTGDKIIEGFGIDNRGNVYTVQGGNEDLLSMFSTSGETVISSVLGRFRGLTDGGSSLVFSSTSNITGENSKLNNQLFKFDLASGEIRQLSNFSSSLTFNEYDRISGDGYSLLKFNSTSGAYDYYDFSPRLSLNIDTGNGNAGIVSIGIAALDGAARALKPIEIDTAASAKSAIFQLRRTAESLALAQSALGASVSRLQSSSRAIAARGLEQKAAFGRVNDVDTAEAAATAVRLQILNQTQVGIISQSSKLSPQIALKLLVGE